MDRVIIYPKVAGELKHGCRYTVSNVGFCGLGGTFFINNQQEVRNGI